MAASHPTGTHTHTGTNTHDDTAPRHESGERVDQERADRTQRDQKPVDHEPVGRQGRIPPGVPYHRVLAGEKRRIGRGLLVLLLLLLGFAVFSVGIALLGGVVDLVLFGRVNPMRGGTEYTPVYHASTMGGIAFLIPWSMLLQRWFYGVPGASLHSVRSRFRFGLFGRALLIVGATWTVGSIVLTSLQPAGEPIAWRLDDLYGVLLVTILLTPLQSAGEEYGLRGLAFRVAGSWPRGPRAALTVGVTVSAVLFAVIHFSTDPWLNLYYLAFGVTTALITWRTGGLEVAIVFHAVNNTIGYILMITTRADPLNALTDRAAGAGDPGTLLPCLYMLVMVAVIWWATRRTGPALT